MKKITIGLCLLAACWLASSLKAQGPQMNCRIGLQYQLSYQNAWGPNKPVIVSIQPESPAAEAGLRIGDVIESIMGQPTTGLSEEEINNLLLNPSSVFVSLKVSSFQYQNKEIQLRKQCRPLDAIGEQDLATAFSHFSVEDVTERSFVMPFTYERNRDIDFSAFKTFGIAPIQGSFNQIDQSMHRIIRRSLERAGLKYQEQGADLLVQTSYRFDKNKQYNPEVEQFPEGFHNYRYNCQLKEMEDAAFAPQDASEAVGRYVLEMGVSLIESKSNKMVWKVSSHEQLYEPLMPEAYAERYLPLALMNFPFHRYDAKPRYLFHRMHYYYTGIYYNTKIMKEVAYVEPQSPAARAGLRAGDVITAINGVPTVSSTDDLVKGYKKFMTDAYELRDRSKIFKDNSGYTRAMPWAPASYDAVRQLLTDHAKYKPVFSYLFSYRPYIADSEVRELVFEVNRAGEKMSFFIPASQQDLSYIELY